MTKNPLDEIIIDEDIKPDLNLLASILKGNLRITKNGEIIFEEKVRVGAAWKRELYYLLARKVIVIKKLKQIKEEVSNKEISEEAFIPPQTLSRFPTRELKPVLKKTKRGLYIIPNYNLLKSKRLLEGKIKIPREKKKSKK